ncbi:MAG: peptidoglycan DD-metalloendopeptidase family protein [Bifidobacteriaceae bacterium]|jgi:murein DD-endopeptidase MepM/ murein hydrolase activator NlpD|nr:peptidoglycan DD-metalloendopeptidase family protein [Bifidobacteriaceae bacterium]
MAAVSATATAVATAWANRSQGWRLLVGATLGLLLPPCVIGALVGLLAAGAQTGAARASGCGWTVPGDGPVNSPFGPRHLAGLPLASRNHQGVDLGGAGSPIYPAADGRVVFAGFSGGYGIIKIDHGEDLFTRYLHMWAPTKYVSTGDQVASGQLIGENGCSAPAGGCGGPHLHFEVRPDDTAADPVAFYSELGLTLGVDRGGTSQPCADGSGDGADGSLDGSPKQIARAMLPNHGWTDPAQWDALELLWTKESSWDPAAVNPSSGACGIPQALPCSKMASAGPDYRTDPATQIAWGLGYIESRYGSPAAAWEFWQSHNWY